MVFLTHSNARAALSAKGFEMTDETKLQVSVQLTPEQVAEAWWGLGSDEQAQFYAHLHRISKGVLCLQTAYMVSHIIETENSDARDAFCTIHNHSTEYVETAVDMRCHAAIRGIAKMADAARATH